MAALRASQTTRRWRQSRQAPRAAPENHGAIEVEHRRHVRLIQVVSPRMQELRATSQDERRLNYLGCGEEIAHAPSRHEVTTKTALKHCNFGRLNPRHLIYHIKP